MSLEYLTWCMTRLTPHEYVVYQVCRHIGSDVDTQIKTIAEIAGLSPDTTRHHMQALQRLGFVLYDSSTGTGTTLLWVRLSQHEKLPDIRGLKRGRLSVTVKDPTGKTHNIKRGAIRQFCDTHGLNRRCLYDILEGKRRQHKGWSA